MSCKGQRSVAMLQYYKQHWHKPTVLEISQLHVLMLKNQENHTNATNEVFPALYLLYKAKPVEADITRSAN